MSGANTRGVLVRFRDINWDKGEERSFIYSLPTQQDHVLPVLQLFFATRTRSLKIDGIFSSIPSFNWGIFSNEAATFKSIARERK